MADAPLPAGTDDDELAGVLRAGAKIQQDTLQLIASENLTAAHVNALTGSSVTDWFGDTTTRRTYGEAGDPLVALDALARTRARDLFGAEYANVAPHSGSSANLAACLALVAPGDTVLGMHVDSGGHISHGAARNLSGILYRAVGYQVDPHTELIDFDAVRRLARRVRPRAIICGANSYPRVIDAQPFREICDEIDAALIFDAANVAGFVVTGAHPHPVGIADVVTFATHKTLRGPRSGALVSSAELGARLDAAVSPGVQGTPLPHVLAAVAAALHDAAQPAYRGYIDQVLANARALAGAVQQQGLRLVTGGTDTHMVMADLRSLGEISGSEAVALLDRAGISATRCPVGADPRWPDDTSGVKLGTLTATTLGMGNEEMTHIAELVCRLLRERDVRAVREVRDAVHDLRRQFPWPVQPPHLATSAGVRDVL